MLSMLLWACEADFLILFVLLYIEHITCHFNRHQKTGEFADALQKQFLINRIRLFKPFEKLMDL